MPTGLFATVMLVFFQAFWMIAVLNIVITVFLSGVIKFTQPSLRDQLKTKMHQNRIDAHELMELFRGFEGDGLHKMTSHELTKCAQNQHVHDFLAMRDITVKDAALFAQMVIEMSEAHADEGKSQIQILAEDCFKLRGFATTLDLHVLGYELKSQQAANQRLLEQLLEKSDLALASIRSPKDLADSKQMASSSLSAGSVHASASRGAGATGGARGQAPNADATYTL
jgi:hypothetical protein